MDTKERTRETVESILAELHAKIDTLKERVEKLCETTDCLGAVEQNDNSPEKKNVKN
jgi:hypothetical protein